MTWDKGWHATVTGPSGIASSVQVCRVGLINVVKVPKGVSIVSFTYTPVGFSTGLAISLFTFAALVLGALAILVVSSRRRASVAGRPQRMPDR